MTGRIFIKLIAAVLLLLLVAIVAVDFLVSQVAESTYMETLERDLLDKGRLLALAIPNGAPSDQVLRQYAESGRGRVTIIARDGRVLADSEASAATMENHGDRVEVKAALQGRPGSVRRTSPTLGVPFLYVAVPVYAGALRIAVPLSEVQDRVDTIRRRMLVATAVAFLPAVLLAAIFARWLSRRLGRIIEYAAEVAKGNFEARLVRPGTDELGLLESKLNETGEKLEGMFKALQHEHAELERVERIRKDFVINVSHELRTPLASIQGYTETLLDGAVHDPDHNVRFLGIIRQNAQRLTHLTADLLTLSRVELKQQKFQFASYHVCALVQNTIDCIQPIADKKSITLELCPPDAPAEAFCDAEAVNQILTNLVENALKYTPEGGSIRVGVRPQPGQEKVEIYVEDTGIGIPPEDLPRLFERFYRVDKARSRELGGTGLGLSIVKHLVWAQGGEVRIESTVGKGSTFSFTLPTEDIGMPEDGEIRNSLTML